MGSSFFHQPQTYKNSNFIHIFIYRVTEIKIMKDSVKKIIIAVVAVAFVVGAVLFALNAINGGNQATTGNNTDLITGANESVPVESVEETENAEESTVAPDVEKA